MDHEEIRKKAQKKVEEKKGFYITAFIFGGVSMLLVVLSLILGLEMNVTIWLLFPIVVFAMILGIMYLAIFGIPGTNVMTDEWEEREIRRETYRIYRKNGIQLPEDVELSDEDRLELKELERLKQKWEDRDDFV